MATKPLSACTQYIRLKENNTLQTGRARHRKYPSKPKLHRKGGSDELERRLPAGTAFALIADRTPRGDEEYMLWTVLLLLFVLWLLGVITHIAGGLVYLLLVIALILLVIQLLGPRRVAL